MRTSKSTTRLKRHMMKKIRHIGLTLTLLVAAALVTITAAQEESDPILEFYCRRAAETYDSRNPLERGISFSFRATTHYMSIGEHGEVVGQDSGIIDYYYSFGQLDSSEVILSPERSQKVLALDFANVFAGDYEFFFFPNDTGGTDLAIGFDTPSREDSLPVGLAVIDRDMFYLRWLYLHYPNKKYHKRYSRSFRFTEYDGYIFADSLWQVTARKGVFTTDFFRTETEISDITIYR
ncbi:MAG: hypothetical protein JSU74_05730 [Candidatus Zixiibacteriota bacterium]|nr:MAG: hypothetical protein JSU74_05730 [candidate division Zixibacteria bacterium]